MKKQTKQLLVLVALIAVFAGVYFGVRAYNRSQEEKEAAGEAEDVYVMQLDSADIESFSYLYEGENIEFRKQDGSWVYVGDETVKIDGDAVDRMLKNLEGVKATRVVEDVKDVSEYGFDEPKNVINVRMGDREATLKIGMYNDILQGYYMMNGEAGSTVYLASASIYSAFNESVEALTVEEPSVTPEPESGAEDKDVK